MSTRKVDDLVRALGIDAGVSKSEVSRICAELDSVVGAFRDRSLGHTAFPYVFLDATYVKAHAGAQVVAKAIVIATGVTRSGDREVLGLAVGDSEDGAFWTAFLRSLRARGLAGVRLVISDAHEGLKAAIGGVLLGAAWQRCRVHFLRNVLARVPKGSAEMVLAAIRTIFAQPDGAAVAEQLDEIAARLAPRFPALALVLVEAKSDLLAFTAFPVSHWRKIWSTNPLERVNKEIKRRTDVVGIFPNEAAGLRDVWFNGYHHLHDSDLERFGPVQGERLSEILSGPGAKWNQRFGQHSVELSRAGKPITLPGGLQPTLLSPGRSGPESLIPDWDRECKRAGLVLGSTGSYERAPRDFEAMGPLDIAGLASTPFSADPSKPNRTSIAVLADYAGRAVLLAADGHADRLAESLQPLAQRHPAKRLPLAAFKLPHHGSRYNLSPRRLALVDCRRYLVSSSGAQFHHPHREALARILAARRGVEFVFNYRSPETIVWDDAELMREHRYMVSYPAAGQDGTIKVDLMTSPPPST